MKQSTFSKLRNFQSLKLYKNGLFTTIQLNKAEKYICWQRWTSKDRHNWALQNNFLRLKDVKQILKNL